MTEATPRLDVNDLKKRSTRREFVKDTAAAVGVGALAYLAGGQTAYTVLDGYAMDIVAAAEKEVNQGILDLREFSGALEERLESEKKRLEDFYEENVIQIYEEIGEATPQDIQKLERGLEAIINNVGETEDYYNFVERVRILKDRVDKRLMSLDSKLEEMSPEALRKVNDTIRKYLGQPYGEQGKRHREALQGRLETLCKIYDTNSDNRRAQIEVLQTLNSYLQDSKLSPEEKELYKFLRKEYSKEGRCEDLRDFIQNYETYGERNETLLSLRASLSTLEDTYQKVVENKDYALELQGLLKQGIELKEKVREKSAQEVAKYKEEIERQVSEQKDAIHGFITKLKDKGYGIETRDDLINKTPMSNAIREKGAEGLHRICRATATLTGALGAYLTWNKLGQSRKVRARDDALDQAVADYNALADRYNEDVAI